MGFTVPEEIALLTETLRPVGTQAFGFEPGDRGLVFLVPAPAGKPT